MPGQTHQKNDDNDDDNKWIKLRPHNIKELKSMDWKFSPNDFFPWQNIKKKFHKSKWQVLSNNPKCIFDEVVLNYHDWDWRKKKKFSAIFGDYQWREEASDGFLK